MKRTIIPAICLSLMFVKNSPAYDIVVGTNHLDVVFENSSTPSPLKDFIVTDVQRCYDAWGTNVTIEPNLPMRPGSYLRANVFMGPYYLEDTSDRQRGIDVPEDVVTNSVGQLSLMVPSILIQKYSDGLDFMTNHFAQVQAADAFVDFVSSSAFASISSNQVSDYILVKDATPQTYLDSAEDLVKGIVGQEFYHPSILGFTYSDWGPDETNLWVFIPTARRIKRPAWSFDVLPAIWHDGKWKLSLWDATE